MFHTNPFNKNFHRGVTQAQLNDIYDYKKYIMEDKDIKGIRNIPIINKDDDKRNTEVHLPSSSEPTQHGDSQ